jgi:hypothetical protein
MSNRIGVTASHLLNDISLLKRAALVFDQFIVCFVEEFTNEQVLADLHWLTNNGIVLDAVKPMKNYLGETFGLNKVTIAQAASDVMKRHEFGFEEFMLRVSAYYLGNHLHANTVILASESDSKLPLLGSGAESVIEVVMRHVPQPSVDTPWEAILDWRSDNQTQIKFRRLKKWMTDVTSIERRPKDLEDELGYLLDEYRAHMAIHRIKTNIGTVRSLIVGTAGLAENIIKLNWNRVASSLFSIRERHAALLEAEQKAPGRELAYIVEATDRFGR